MFFKNRIFNINLKVSFFDKMFQTWTKIIYKFQIFCAYLWCYTSDCPLQQFSRAFWGWTTRTHASLVIVTPLRTLFFRDSCVHTRISYNITVLCACSRHCIDWFQTHQLTKDKNQDQHRTPHFHCIWNIKSMIVNISVPDSNPRVRK